MTPAAAAPVASNSLWLWAAALAITWLSGIESTWHRLGDSTAGFRSANQYWQELDRQAKAQQLGQQSVLSKADRVEWFRATLRAESKPRDTGQAPDKKPLDDKQLLDARRKALAAEVERRLASSPPPAKLAVPTPGTAEKDPVCDDLLGRATEVVKAAKPASESALVSATQRLANFCADARLLNDSESLRRRKDQAQAELVAKRDEAAQQQEKFQKEMDDKKSGNDVDFEMLGVKFKAPALLAPALWCLFAASWLLAAQRPAAAPPDRAMVLGIAVVLLAVQLRVSWIGLSLAQFEGGLRWRALVAVVLVAAIGCSTFWLVSMACRRVADPADTAATPGRPWWLAVLGAGAAALAVPAALPGAVLHGVQSALSALLAGSVVGGAALAAWPRGTVQAADHQRAAARRRQVLAAVAVATLLIVFTHRKVVLARRHQPSSYAWRLERLARRRDRLRARAGSLAGLAPGFYHAHREPPRSTVVHYVRPGGQTAVGARMPDVKRLQPLGKLPRYPWLGISSKNDLYAWTSAVPSTPSLEDDRQSLRGFRLCHATASWACENAALDLLERHGAGPANIAAAIQLLLLGIRHDAVFRSRSGSLRKQASADYRLYDLAAGLAVRYRQPHVIEELVRRIRQSGHELSFLSRTRKWADFRSRWHRRWMDRRAPVVWQTSTRRFVF